MIAFRRGGDMVAEMAMQPMMRDGGAPAMNKRLPMPAAAEGNLAPLPEA